MRPERLPSILVLAAASLAFGGNLPDLPDFSDLSLDELANVKVTSFTKKEQKLSQVAGAIYVITQEQIARSGLTSVPELLRLAPGVDVAQVNGNQWAVSIRGPIGAYSNKLLVLIDGRSIYSPLFSGVFWEIGMPLLDDIERIEVIRGPGATIWGANAVLGVINIITKSARDTHGTAITSGAGSTDRAFGSARMGGEIGSMNYRAYFGGNDNASLSQASGAKADDAWNSVQGGFRLDGSHNKDTWILEGGLFRASENDTGTGISLATQNVVETPSHFDSLAANLTGEWRRRFGETGELRLQSYYDYADRPQPQASKAAVGTFDTELQYDFKAGHVHNFSLGGGERLISENVVTPDEFVFHPAQLTYSNLNAFAQDEMHFAHDALVFTLGAKLEHNHFGGWGTEPSANLMWMPAKRHSLWISAARSRRTPSLFEMAVESPGNVYPASAATGGLPVDSTFGPSPGFSTESVNDFEAGYRVQLSKKFSADVALFYDQYADVRSIVFGIPVLAFTPVPHLDVTGANSNGVAATGKGGEASIAWQVLPEWKLEGSYSYIVIDSWLTSSAPSGSTNEIGKAPSRNQWRLQSYVNLSKSWKLDSFLYWTGRGDPSNTYGPDILVPAYTRLDLRLGYRVSHHWQVSLAGQNLLQARHLEAVAELLSANSWVNRSVYLKSSWQF
jgi:iron complex outermembrane receptor protein